MASGLMRAMNWKHSGVLKETTDWGFALPKASNVANAGYPTVFAMLP